MASDNSPQILLTGATGYIGGTVLDQLLKSNTQGLANKTITCLVRGSQRERTLRLAYGERVHTLLYDGIEDLAAATNAAAQHDIVINTSVGHHEASVQALLRGLAQRKALMGRDVWMINTSGTSNMGDRPISRVFVHEIDPTGNVRQFDDVNDDIYGWERARDAIEPYPQRTTELEFIDAGQKLGIRTLSIMPPGIYGIGTGLFNKLGTLIPAYIRSMLDSGFAAVAGSGTGQMDWVHISDVGDLYLLVLRDILEQGGSSIPVGRKAIMFCGSSRHSWTEVAQRAADACYQQGKIASSEVRNVSLAEFAKMVQKGVGDWFSEEWAETGLSSDSRTVASAARQLGWQPSRGSLEWDSTFQADVKGVLSGK